MNTVLSRRVSLIPARRLPTILSPTIGGATGGSPGCPAIRLRAYRPRYRLRLFPADSPAFTDRIEFTLSRCVGTLLRTGRSRSVALHPASRRRSYGSIPHDSSPQGNGLAPFGLRAFSGALERLALRAVAPRAAGHPCPFVSPALRGRSARSASTPSAPEMARRPNGASPFPCGEESWGIEP